MKKENKYAEVIIDLPTQELGHPFSYKIPEDLKNNLKTGQMVLVPFSHHLRIGYIVHLTQEKPTLPTLEIKELLDDSSYFTENEVGLARWISDYYFAPLSECIKLILPAGRSLQIEERVDINQQKRYKVSKPKISEKKDKWASLGFPPHLFEQKIEEIQKFSKQKEVLNYIFTRQGEVPLKKLKEDILVSLSTLKSLEKKEYIKIFKVPQERTLLYSPMEEKKHYQLSSRQKEVIEIIKKSLTEKEFAKFLLQGVTASGKTEIYLHVIAECLKLGRTAIVLVPEIALTPQTIDRFHSRFGDLVAVLHSRLSLGERYDQWKAIQEQKYQIVVGARSAIFAPLKNIGVIIIDEEHEPSYKQNNSPRYQAKDVANLRAKLSGAVLILGSATPSLESRFLMSSESNHLILLNQRATGLPYPDVEIVDMRAELKSGNKSIFSQSLLEAIKNSIEQKEQVILFLNRRGFANFILCRDCGYVMKCPNCDISLTYHRDRNIMRCHHCNIFKGVPLVCPVCKNPDIRYFGVGTQRVEEDLKSILGDVSILRMDADTTKRKYDYHRILTNFRSGKADILLGTQMIAKGHDFPNVTLVGIINADTALNLPDFRAAERTFQLLTQVGGRAGRGEKPGKIIIQTYNPENKAIISVKDENYEEFYQTEIKERESLNYPPFSKIINIVLSSSSWERLKQANQVLKDLVKKSELEKFCQILGPAPCPLSRIKNRYRWHLILKINQDEEKVRNIIKQILKSHLLKIEDLRVIVDVDPISIL